MKEKHTRTADTVFCGGTVITMEDPVEAREMDLAVGEGKILALGQKGELNALIGDETRIVDVKGKTVMPGLIDVHNHMMWFGQYLEMLELSPLTVKSIEEMVAKLRDRADQTPEGNWVKAWGYDNTFLKEKRHPTRDDLDRACQNHPVSLMRTCMHVMVVNSKALEMAGITENTVDPHGGKIGKDEHGRPNGLLFELPAMNLVNRLIPNPDSTSCAHSLKLASEVYVSEGLTMVTEAGAGWSGNPNEAAGFQIAVQSGFLKPRVCLGLMEKTYNLLPGNKGTGFFTGFGDDRLWIGPAKFVADGGIGAKTAALSQPFEGSDGCGILYEDAESLTKRMEEVHKAGFQISIHAAGDRTIDIVLTAFESILSKYPRPHRHRIEHAILCRPDLITRIRKLNIVAVVQPAFLSYLGDSYIRNLGQQRLPITIPIKTLLKEGIVVAGSSDRPVTVGNPWIGIHSAVNRTTITGSTISQEEAVSVTDALKLYTTNAAYVNFVEDEVGTLCPGKLADIVVLARNPLEVYPKTLKDVEADMTFIGGQEVYARG